MNTRIFKIATRVQKNLNWPKIGTLPQHVQKYMRKYGRTGPGYWRKVERAVTAQLVDQRL